MQFNIPTSSLVLVLSALLSVHASPVANNGLALDARDIVDSSFLQRAAVVEARQDTATATATDAVTASATKTKKAKGTKAAVVSTDASGAVVTVSADPAAKASKKAAKASKKASKSAASAAAAATAVAAATTDAAAAAATTAA